MSLSVARLIALSISRSLCCSVTLFVARFASQSVTRSIGQSLSVARLVVRSVGRSLCLSHGWLRSLLLSRSVTVGCFFSCAVGRYMKKLKQKTHSKDLTVIIALTLQQ